MPYNNQIVLLYVGFLCIILIFPAESDLSHDNMIDYTNSFIIYLLPSTEDLFNTSYKIKESNFT